MSDNAITVISTVRHGITEFNKLHKIAGTIDCALNEDGIVQATSASAAFDHSQFDVIISSPLRRCFDTAILLTGLSEKQIIRHGGCSERNYGKMQGLTEEEVARMNPPILYVRVGKFSHSLNPPGGESFEQLHKRAIDFSIELFDRYRGKRILVVSHQTFLQQLHGHYLDMDPYHSLGLDILTLERNDFEFDGNDALLRTSTKPLSTVDFQSW